MRDRLAIEQLLLRIPGVDKAGGGRVAELVANRLSVELAGSDRAAALPSVLNVRITATAGLSDAALAELIARRIVEALR